jgi:Family of unknown function (DUF6476)
MWVALKSMSQPCAFARVTNGGVIPMRALKILVVVMGVMLVAGFTTLVALVAGRVSRDGPAAVAAHGFGSLAIDIPRGARIEAMTAGPDRLILALALPDGGRQLVVIDLAKGVRLGTIQLHPIP